MLLVVSMVPLLYKALYMRMSMLFVIFINDLVDICTNNIKLFFADDAKMHCHIKEISDKDRLQTGIDKFVNWTDKLQVTLNVVKCKVTSFHHRRYLNTSALPRPIYVMNNTVLDEVEEMLILVYGTLYLNTMQQNPFRAKAPPRRDTALPYSYV